MSMSLESSQEKELTLLRLPFSSDQHLLSPGNGNGNNSPSASTSSRKQHPYHNHSNRYMDSTDEVDSSTALSASGQSLSCSKNGSKGSKKEDRKKDDRSATRIRRRRKKKKEKEAPSVLSEEESVQDALPL